nr:unnamed protein product [Callosobruchus analis]CAI5832272.1 unnamed protein product [Callosobruchus analis]
MGNPVWCVLWFFVLIIAAFPIAFFCCFWYVICYFFSPCLKFCQDISDFLLKGLQLPGFAAGKMIHCEGC